MRPLENDLFLRACRREPTERTPIWLMRQAGRYLPSYRALRERYDFLTLCRTPELAAEITVQPVEQLDVDAAILFSDILVVPEAMGLTLRIEEGVGPHLEDPVRTAADVARLTVPDPREKLGYVLNAIRVTRERLRGRVPLIGFAGAPWTLFAYMVEGSGTGDFRRARVFVHEDPRTAHALLEKIARTVARFLLAQIEAGAHAVQLFDTWAGILDPDGFSEFSLAYVRQVIEAVKAAAPPSVPVLLFSRGTAAWSEALAETGADVLSVDWTCDLARVRWVVKDRVALQGNLDPIVLLASPEVVVREARKILARFGVGDGHIFNLGHGVLPETPVENVRRLVDTVKRESPQYHVQREDAPS
ncbi:MAG: uroporphyrinogen decarboxylase [Blastocatellia bacterium]|nr:uroporphyrinogen decarboxylase [Blastocatellia bacterium]MCS7156181.1 uroporphyrinogen decarboxylase [Blastocatellia bacterium]MCX7751469.1 uroporphyrinogen decarboxylase [Blastocatellia bacterium]MDW8169182.1 uroporphyrinogen decarboxylase [Acidobacteriota bacterium]MDW8256043.1 uroporphyrinogen decarboxylase [Acidobacteriota bacterium]